MKPVKTMLTEKDLKAKVKAQKMIMAKTNKNTSRKNSPHNHMNHHLETTLKLKYAVLSLKTQGMQIKLPHYEKCFINYFYRPLMKVRISRQRRDFGHEGYSYIERDAGESITEIKVTKTGYFTKKKVLEMGL